MNNFNVKIDDFIGDVTYFFILIKEKKIDILNFDLNFFINEYINFLEKELSINLLEEFSSNVFILSYMIWIKTKFLLPKNSFSTKFDNEEVLDEIAQDFKNLELKKSLIEYKKFKEVSFIFQKQKEYSKKLLSKKSSQILINKNYNYSFDITLLTDAFIKIAKNFNKNLQNKIQIEKPSIEISKLQNLIIQKLLISENNKIFLLDLIKSIVFNIEYLIGIFLAILNLAKEKKIYLFQNENNLNIELIQKKEV